MTSTGHLVTQFYMASWGLRHPHCNFGDASAWRKREEDFVTAWAAAPAVAEPPYLSQDPRWRCVTLPWIRWLSASPERGTSPLSRQDSTFQRRRWAWRCSWCFSLLFVWISLCTMDIWVGGSPRHTSGRTCVRTTWWRARTSGRDISDTPAGPFLGCVMSQLFLCRHSSVDQKAFSAHQPCVDHVNTQRLKKPRIS